MAIYSLNLVAAVVVRSPLKDGSLYFLTLFCIRSNLLSHAKLSQRPLYPVTPFWAGQNYGVTQMSSKKNATGWSNCFTRQINLVQTIIQALYPWRLEKRIIWREILVKKWKGTLCGCLFVLFCFLFCLCCLLTSFLCYYWKIVSIHIFYDAWIPKAK